MVSRGAVLDLNWEAHGAYLKGTLNGVVMQWRPSMGGVEILSGKSLRGHYSPYLFFDGMLTVYGEMKEVVRFSYGSRGKLGLLNDWPRICVESRGQDPGQGPEFEYMVRTCPDSESYYPEFVDALTAALSIIELDSSS